MKLSEDHYFSPNAFELCQDSFFRWLFLTDNQDSNALKEKLFLSFCGKEQQSQNSKSQNSKKRSYQVEICKVETQVKAENSRTKMRCDLLVTGKIDKQEYLVFIEDKTDNHFCSSQMNFMFSLAEERKNSKNNVRIVYCSSAWLTAQTIQSINQYCPPKNLVAELGVTVTYLYRDDLEEIVNETVSKDVALKNDSILGQFYLYINGIRPITLPLACWTNLDFISCVRRAYFESGADQYFSMSIGGLRGSTKAPEQKDASFLLTKLGDKNKKYPALYWRTNIKSKQHHNLFLVQNDSTNIRFSSCYKNLSKLLSYLSKGHQRRRLALGRKAIFKTVFKSNAEIENALRALFQHLGKGQFCVED